MRESPVCGGRSPPPSCNGALHLTQRCLIGTICNAWDMSLPPWSPRQRCRILNPAARGTLAAAVPAAGVGQMWNSTLTDRCHFSHVPRIGQKNPSCAPTRPNRTSIHPGSKRSLPLPEALRKTFAEDQRRRVFIKHYASGLHQKRKQIHCTVLPLSINLHGDVLRNGVLVSRL